MVFNCLHNQAPQYLVDLCQSVSSVATRQHLHSANRGLLVVPRYRLSSYGRRAFSVAGPAIWNSLPDSLRDPAISRDSFRRFYFQLTCVHSAIELSGRCALQIYLLTYERVQLTWPQRASTHGRWFTSLRCVSSVCLSVCHTPCLYVMSCMRASTHGRWFTSLRCVSSTITARRHNTRSATVFSWFCACLSEYVVNAPITLSV